MNAGNAGGGNYLSWSGVTARGSGGTGVGVETSRVCVKP